MNEQILALAKQAGFYVFADRIYIPTISEDITAYQTKFAELIINECVNVAKNPQWYKKNSSNDWCNSITHVCNAMKEHFGVKE